MVIASACNINRRMTKCPQCDKIGSPHAIRAHIWKVHTEDGQRHKSIPKGYKHTITRKDGKPHSAWNKGLTKETDSRVAKNAENVGRTLREQVRNGTFIPHVMSTDARRRLSIEQSIRNRGGKSQWFLVDGQHVQGTWERDFAQHLTNHFIKWKKLKCHRDVWHYIDSKGKGRSYTPDFYLEELNIFVEIKGFWWGNDRQKMRDVFASNSEKSLLLIEKVLFQKIIASNNPRNILEREQVWSLCDSEKVEN